MLFISEAFAQGAAPTEPDMLANIIPLVLIFGIFYFLLIRPQHKKMKEHNQMVGGLKRGDEVVTGGGILGKINKVEDSILHIEIAQGVVVKVNRSTVLEGINKKEAKEGNKDKKNK